MTYNNFNQALLLVLLSAAAFSCKKTEPLPAQPQNRILQYKVTNLQDTAIYGAINDSARTITVYIPFYFNLPVIDPAIRVSDGATLQSEVVPVAVSDTTTTYSVKGRDGVIATYRLSIIVQSQPLVLEDLSSADAVAEYPANGFLGNVIGNYNTSDLSSFNMQLVSTDASREYSLKVTQAYTSIFLIDGQYILSQAQIPADMDTGLYRVRITLFGQNTATMKYPIHIYYPGPDIQPLYTATPRQGETFTLTAGYSSILRGLNSFSLLVNGSYRPLTVETVTNGSATIRVPVDFPPGLYGTYQLVCDGYGPIVYANQIRGAVKVLPQ